MPLYLTNGSIAASEAQMSDQDETGNDKIHEKIWYLKKGEKIFGPFAAAKVRHFLIEGKIDLRDGVSRDKKNWGFLLSQPEVVPLQMRDPEAFANADVTDELDPGKKGSLWMPIILAIVLIGGAISASMMFQGSENADLPDCTAEPAPGINWNSCNKRSMSAENSNLDGLSAINVVMSGVKMSGSSFKNAQLRYALFEEADLSYSDFTGASLKGANLHGADLTNVIFTGSDMRYADLSDTRLGGVQMINTRLDGAIWNNGKPCKPGSVGECVQ